MKKTFKIIGIIVGVIVLFVVYRLFFAPDGYVMTGASMEPTFTQGTILTPSEDLTKITRGTVVDFSYTSASGKKTELIKRVVGLPGENIEIKNGSIYVNNIITHVDPISIVTDATSTSLKVNFTSPQSTHLSGDEYYVLGDNTSKSPLDSRYIGPIKRNSINVVILGRAPMQLQ